MALILQGITGPERILYVEDDQDIQDVVRFALETLGGMTVELASSGHEALDKVKAFRPDLILLDVMMPGMDGPSTLEALRGLPECAKTPVVFITAKAQGRELERLAAMDVAGVLTKPFDPVQLSGRLRDYWAAFMASR